MKQGELPFTHENRPWFAMDCVEGMDMEWMACMTNIPEVAPNGAGKR